MLATGSFKTIPKYLPLRSITLINYFTMNKSFFSDHRLTFLNRFHLFFHFIITVIILGNKFKRRSEAKSQFG